MLVSELCYFLNSRFPRSLQESYDNAGDQVVFPEQILRGIILAIDLSPDVIQQAIERGCNFILTHHPVFFRSKKSIISSDPFDRMICNLIVHEITVFSIHTNLDKIYHSVIAQVLNLPVHSILIKGDMETGMGTLCVLPEDVSLMSLIEKVCNRLKVEWVTFSGKEDKQIKRIAILNGSGGHFIEKNISMLDADCIITGDVGHHAWHIAGIYNITVIDAGHFGTERPLLTFLSDEIQDFLTKSTGNPDVQLLIADEIIPSRIYSRIK